MFRLLNSFNARQRTYWPGIIEAEKVAAEKSIKENRLLLKENETYLFYVFNGFLRDNPNLTENLKTIDVEIKAKDGFTFKQRVYES